MKQLYPEIEPYDSGMLPVSDIHTLYWEQAGNPNGKPVVFLHGGPGGGLQTDYRRYFNPDVYRIVLFDQRGAGRSTPHANLVDNTTWHLVEDIETIRKHFGIGKWMVFGGSWGSTLSLSYAETHPDRVTELVLRGIFLCRKKEIDWFYQQGASAVFPDVWEQYERVIPEAERGDMVAAYYRRLTSEDESVRIEAAQAWSVWEGATSKLFPSEALIEHFGDSQFAIAMARIECHYFINNTFFQTPNYLIEHVGRIRHLPGIIVQGRYDMVCPMMSAWELHRAWPEADLRVIGDAGHSMSEPGILSELVQATDELGGR